jgi:hypothetical protein
MLPFQIEVATQNTPTELIGLLVRLYPGKTAENRRHMCSSMPVLQQIPFLISRDSRVFAARFRQRIQGSTDSAGMMYRITVEMRPDTVEMRRDETTATGQGEQGG